MKSLHLWSSQDEFGIPIPVRTRFRQCFSLATNLYRYTFNVYNRGGTVVGYLSTDQKVAPEQRTNIIQAFKNFMTGPKTEKNRQQIAALDNGWKFNKLDLSHSRIVDYWNPKKDLDHDICRVLNLPPWKIGLLEGYKYATQESAQREYLQASLNPLLNQIEKRVQRQTH